MKIATFNANSLRMRIDIVLKWLAEHNPDVLCVQETKVQDVDFPAEAFAQSGYQFVFKGQKKYNGVAIFARAAIEDVSFGLDDDPEDQPRLVKAFINDITIVNTYVPQGHAPDSEKFQYKLDWFERLAKYFDRRLKPGRPLIWLGDLNVALEAKDIYDPDALWGHVCYCSEVQNAMNNIISRGFTDLFRKHCTDPDQYTFWDYRANSFRRNHGWRLDYIFATAPLAKKCTTCWIDKTPRGHEKPSDHTFLIAEFNS